MKRRAVHVVYEYDADGRPHSSAYVRLLLPLQHPTIRDQLTVTAGTGYQGEPVDAVIVDRLWRPDVSPALAERLAAEIRRAGARLIYALDDNLFDLPAERNDWPGPDHLRVAEFFLRQADGVLVTTPALRDRLAGFNANMVVLQSALDERLLAGLQGASGGLLERLRRSSRHAARALGLRRKVVGYMGTVTHDDDLLMILPALREVWRRLKGRVEFHLVGVVRHAWTHQALDGLPFRVRHPEGRDSEYPRFMPWFSGIRDWDLAIAPLRDTPFRRCKSDVKFLDYCALGVAGVYSRVPPYEAAVSHGETGWLVANEPAAWAAAVERLLADDALRERLARNASRYLHEERVLARCAGNWVGALATLLDQRTCAAII